MGSRGILVGYMGFGMGCMGFGGMVYHGYAGVNAYAVYIIGWVGCFLAGRQLKQPVIDVLGLFRLF